MQRSDLEKQTKQVVGKQERSVSARTAKRTKTLMIKLTPEEHESIKEFWEDSGVPFSVGARQVLLQHIRRHGSG